MVSFIKKSIGKLFINKIKPIQIELVRASVIFLKNNSKDYIIQQLLSDNKLNVVDFDSKPIDYSHFEEVILPKDTSITFHDTSKNNYVTINTGKATRFIISKLIANNLKLPPNAIIHTLTKIADKAYEVEYDT